MQISLIAAMSSNHIIGIANRLPWHFPHDLQHFKALTLGKPMIMGRKTFQSIGRILPERRSIVVSRTTKNCALNVMSQENIECCAVYDSLVKALDAVEGCAEVMIIGGQSIYAQTIAQASKMYLTIIHHDIAGDTYFPKWNKDEWKVTEQQDFPADSKHAYPYSFLTLQRLFYPMDGAVF